MLFLIFVSGGYQGRIIKNFKVTFDAIETEMPSGKNSIGECHSTFMMSPWPSGRLILKK